MESLSQAIQECPIIDHHAHNLLLPAEVESKSLLSVVSEAQGPALQHVPSALAHIRAVRQLADELDCEPDWNIVVGHIHSARKLPNNGWAKKCFQGIATALVDDGLDKDTVHPVAWHNCLTTHACKRIVRIEVLAQDILAEVLSQSLPSPGLLVAQRFTAAVEAALRDPDVVGFKSVICYRTGLNVPIIKDQFAAEFDIHLADCEPAKLSKLEHERLNPLFVNLTASCIANNLVNRKPFQFHTGLGDNDIQLRLSSASYLQPLIAAWPNVQFVLLHASYPFTREAGYLAAVYENCYLDLSLVFPLVSQDGQERVLREAFDLCPAEKLCWSTDGHWFPETYLLAVRQVRESLQKVLGDYVNTGALSFEQAVNCAQHVLYETSRKLYRLDLPPLQTPQPQLVEQMASLRRKDDDYTRFENFMKSYPKVRYLHIQYVDYCAIRRGRVIPVKRAFQAFKNGKFVGIQRGVFRMLPNDSMPPNTVHQGEWALRPILDSLRLTPQPEVASVQCEIQLKDGRELAHDPRSVLRRVVEQGASQHGMHFTAGFEIEVIFMQPTLGDGHFNVANLGYGHVWSGAAAVESKKATALIRDILAAFDAWGVELEQYHAEGAKSQYEFILAPLPVFAAVDSLLAARSAICSAADNHGLRATCVPKIIGQGFGTGAHVHLSMTPEARYQNFYAGVLSHMPAIMAFAMSSPVSYQRQGDGCWSGGTWVCWGDQNREACLRRVEDSHWECKVVDGFAHPYLVLAAIIGAGLHGVAERMSLPGGSVDVNPGDLTDEQRTAYGITRRLPDSLEMALEALQEDSTLCKIMGTDTIKTFVEVKEAEAAIVNSFDDEHARQDWLVARF